MDGEQARLVQGMRFKSHHDRRALSCALRLRRHEVRHHGPHGDPGRLGQPCRISGFSRWVVYQPRGDRRSRARLYALLRRKLHQFNNKRCRDLGYWKATGCLRWCSERHGMDGRNGFGRGCVWRVWHLLRDRCGGRPRNLSVFVR